MLYYFVGCFSCTETETVTVLLFVLSLGNMAEFAICTESNSRWEGLLLAYTYSSVKYTIVEERIELLNAAEYVGG